MQHPPTHAVLRERLRGQHKIEWRPLADVAYLAGCAAVAAAVAWGSRAAGAGAGVGTCVALIGAAEAAWFLMSKWR